MYAGVLGKVIGVYLGRPIEGWTWERIEDRLGEVSYYVNDRLDVPLIVTDDDITGTFTFVRALPDHGYPDVLEPELIGRTWLNYLIEDRTILWWGGMGNSTEHTAYLRLKSGVTAPQSGSVAMNGQVVAEQIGGQIFIDSWAMVAPGDPERAAELARRAASVSHDGAAVHAAQVIAAMESQAFIEADLGRLLDVGLSQIPNDSVIRRLIDGLRDQRSGHADWRRARRWLAESYGYESYGGNVHVVPNHGLIVLSLLFGDDDFQKTLMIVNTSGWDTDCNSGNVGCLMGIKNGLAGIDQGPDWRGPIADRVYLPTADGGRCISDAVREADALVSIAHGMRGLEYVPSKQGARFHFDQPGSVQGFTVNPDDMSAATIENVLDRARDGGRALAITLTEASDRAPVFVSTPTSIPKMPTNAGGYELLGSPTLYSGQIVHSRVEADRRNAGPIEVRLALRHFDADDAIVMVRDQSRVLSRGESAELSWTMPRLDGLPILEIGLELAGRSPDAVLLDYLTWDGPPDVRFRKAEGSGVMWQRAWVDAVSSWDRRVPETFRIMQSQGTGLLMQGSREWRGYSAEADLRVHMGGAGGLAVNVQGLERWLGLLVRPTGTVELVRELHGRTILAREDLHLDVSVPRRLRLDTRADRVLAYVDGELLFEIDADDRLDGGAVALVCEEARVESHEVSVRPSP